MIREFLAFIALGVAGFLAHLIDVALIFGMPAAGYQVAEYWVPRRRTDGLWRRAARGCGAVAGLLLGITMRFVLW